MTTDAGRAGGRARRVDADRNVETIVQAGLRTLARDPRASMATIASASGLARATVYGHFPTSASLMREIFKRAITQTEQVLAGLDMEGPAPATLERFMRATWESADPYRLVRAMVSAEEVAHRARWVKERLEELLARGQRSGELRDDMPARWLADVVELLLFRTSDGVAHGELDADSALDALLHSVRAVTEPVPRT
ncbi:TetR/AcrR family transcriptional regulator [Streptomyces sp. enrichment culture]|uniref:TetR/AcrR family transcriptional regulator n=1 Tax=Streptomyces sp. enrichment culture TaxID=1795815 RepID=UPI003F56C5E1